MDLQIVLFFYMVTELGLSASDQYSTIDAASAYRVVELYKVRKNVFTRENIMKKQLNKQNINIF